MSRRADSRTKAGGKRERTRAALVAAALDVVAAKGFAAASLDDIAARAGMTKGAIYSNFPSKAALLLAAMSAKGLTLTSSRPPAVTVGEELDAMATDLSATLRRAKGEASFLAEFQLYALSDPAIRKEVAAAYAEGFTGTAAYLARLKDLGPEMPPRHLAVALQAVALGFMVQALITPGEISDAVIVETLKALADGLASNRAEIEQG
jgi:AcrR family transcriptional regulator